MFDPASLKQALQSLEFDQAATRCAVAFSGGADSTALLLALADLMPPERIVALHFNHKINPASGQWQTHCEAVCNRLGVGFECVSWNSADKENGFSEALARDARYQWFNRVVPPDAALLTGHHLDDQAETVLMSLSEGRNLERIAAMRGCRPLRFGDKRLLLRPLLGFRRNELEQFVLQRNETWIDDPANTDIAHSRNLVRHDVLPVLSARWPQVGESIHRFATQLGELLEVSANYADKELAALERPDRKTLFCSGTPLESASLNAMPPARFKLLMRRWLHRAGVTSASDRQLAEFARQLGNASNDHHCRMSAGEAEVQYFDHHLHVLTRPADRSNQDVPCFQHIHQIDDGLSVLFYSHPDGLDRQLLENGQLQWRTRRGGDRFAFSAAAGSMPLKKAMQSKRVAPWLRQSLPLLADGDNPVWVHGLGVNAAIDGDADSADRVLPEFFLP